ncbi:hypothetical protein [Actinoplanes auranticolor]|uniref:Uncharacterized protein n=1 Tax=Actinoplanes auranticolor TaxID=47988 RepID=A0A919VXC6_9ACTN|nr:hypothetical protein [Actinoplanes auranticolor]GIM80546.1 hypothetical protein Aau02nite_91090 [Actinoplanes auranticolor]
MSATGDSGSSSEPIDRDRTNDDLEDWLSDLRTDVSAAPHEWLDEDSVGKEPTDQAVERSPLTRGEHGTDASKPGGGGRHRA